MKRIFATRLRSRTSVAFITTIALLATAAVAAALVPGSGSAAATQAKTTKVAYVDGSCANSWRVLVRLDFEYAASLDKRISGVKYFCAQGDLAKEQAAIKSAAAQGYNPIVVFSDFGPALLPAIRSAYKQGVQVVPWLVDVGGTPGRDYTAIVSDDAAGYGVAAANFFGKKFKGKGNIVMISGPAGNPYETTIRKSMEATFAKKYPGVKLLELAWADWNPAKSAQAAATLLAKYPKIDGAHISEASAVIPVLNEWKKSGKPLPAFYSNDLNALFAEYLKLKPKNPSVAFGFQSARTWGAVNALKVGMAAWAGQRINKSLLKMRAIARECETPPGYCKRLYDPTMGPNYYPTAITPKPIVRKALKKK